MCLGHRHSVIGLQRVSHLHPGQREDAVEFILAGLDGSGVHECIIELKKTQTIRTKTQTDSQNSLN